jgi:TolB protein
MRDPRTGRARIVAAAVVALAAIGFAPAAHAGSPGANGKLAFADAEGIAVVNPDGSGFRQLTHDDDVDPAWSPDGRKIAFERRAGGSQSDIYVMNADGSGVRQLTSAAGTESHPTWSPDALQIAFGAGDLRVLAIPAAGGPSRVVVSRGWEPDWSPDGSLIAYMSDRRLPGDPTSTNVTAVWKAAPDGSGAQRVVYGRSHSDLDWSPDGQAIAFYMGTETGASGWAAHDNSDGGIFGAGYPPWPDQPLIITSPAWSPDGRYAAFGAYYDQDDYRIGIEDLQTGAVREFDLPAGAPAGRADLDWQPVPKEGPPPVEPGPGEPVNHAPVCRAVKASPKRFSWRADGRLKRVRLSGGSDPDGDAVALRIIWIGQDEPRTSRGDRTSPDAKWTSDPRVVLIRHERARKGDGRVYWVDYALTDPRGARCIGTVRVKVPRHRNRRALESAFYADSVVLSASQRRLRGR